MNWDISSNIVLKHETLYKGPFDIANQSTLETIPLKRSLKIIPNFIFDQNLNKNFWVFSRHFCLTKVGYINVMTRENATTKQVEGCLDFISLSNAKLKLIVCAIL